MHAPKKHRRPRRHTRHRHAAARHHAERRNASPESAGAPGGGGAAPDEPESEPESEPEEDPEAAGEDDSLEGDEHMFGLFKRIAKIGAGGLSLVRKIPGVNVAALVIPGGTAALAAVGAADHVLEAVNASHPEKRAAGLKVVKATQALAKAGNIEAANGMTMLGKRAAALRAAHLHRVNPTTGVVRKVGK